MIWALVAFHASAQKSDVDQVLQSRYKSPTKSIVIDVEAKLDAAILWDLQQRLSKTFWQTVQINPGFSMSFDHVEKLGDRKYTMADLMAAYERIRVLAPAVHHVLLVDGETYTPGRSRNYSLSRNAPLKGSVGVISVEVLMLPPYVTQEFATRRLTERLYKSIKKRLITMYGYQPAVPDCLLRFFRSVAFIDELPDDVCPADRRILEAEGILRPRM